MRQFISILNRYVYKSGRLFWLGFVLISLAVLLSGCEVPKTVNDVVNEIDKTRNTIESLSSGWRDELPKLVKDLNGLESQVSSDVKQLVADTTNQVQDLAAQAIQFSDAKAQDLIAQAGVEFRCDAGFVKAGVLAQLQSIEDDLRFWDKNQRHLDQKPKHAVCWINPTVLSLYPSGNNWAIDTSNMSDKNIVHVFGYNFLQETLPTLELQDANGRTMRNVNLAAAYVTHYQINLDFSNEDFAAVQSGARVVFRWPPDQPDPNTMNLTLHPPAKLKISNPVFNPASPTAQKDAVTLKVTITNIGGMRSGNIVAVWQPDPLDQKQYPITLPKPIDPGAPTDVSFPGYVYQRSGPINSVVSLNTGDDTLNYALTVAPPPPPPPAPERDLPGFPQINLITYGKFIGGFGLDVEYGGECSNGYVRSFNNVETTDVRGRASAENLGWVDDNPKNCKIRVHYSIAASSPNPSPNYVTVTILIKEKGE